MRNRNHFPLFLNNYKHQKTTPTGTHTHRTEKTHPTAHTPDGSQLFFGCTNASKECQQHHWTSWTKKRIYPFCLQHELLNFSSLIFKMLFNGKPPYWHISNMPILQVSTRHRDAVSLDQIPAFHRSIRHIAGNHTCVKTCQGRSIFFRTSHSWLHSLQIPRKSWKGNL